MPDRKVVRRRRAVFALLVLASVALVTFYFGGSGALQTLQNGVQAVLQPIESGASTVVKPIRDAVDWIGGTLSAQDENEVLEAEVEELRTELAEAQTDARDADQLRALVDLREEEGYPDGVETVTARVIAQSPTTWYSTIQVDKGSRDGVEVDQPVVAGGGLAGKVTDVTGGTATVTLITDADSAVSAQLPKTGTRGVVKPQVGRPDDLLLDFLDADDEIEEGTTVVTSGSTSTRLESLFPRGIPIGEVSRVDPDERELYQRVHVDPYADLERIDYVQVLVGGVPVQSAEVSP
jgi:rod shape-determining protein MreC